MGKQLSEQQKEEIKQTENSAITFYKLRDYGNALQTFQLVLEFYSEHYEKTNIQFAVAYYNIGRAAFNLGQYETALENYKLAFEHRNKYDLENTTSIKKIRSAIQEALEEKQVAWKFLETFKNISEPQEQQLNDLITKNAKMPPNQEHMPKSPYAYPWDGALSKIDHLFISMLEQSLCSYTYSSLYYLYQETLVEEDKNKVTALQEYIKTTSKGLMSLYSITGLEFSDFVKNNDAQMKIFVFMNAYLFYMTDIGNCSHKAAESAFKIKRILPDATVILNNGKDRNNTVVEITYQNKNYIYDPNMHPYLLFDKEYYYQNCHPFNELLQPGKKPFKLEIDENLTTEYETFKSKLDKIKNQPDQSTEPFSLVNALIDLETQFLSITDDQQITMYLKEELLSVLTGKPSLSLNRTIEILITEVLFKNNEQHYTADEVKAAYTKLCTFLNCEVNGFDALLRVMNITNEVIQDIKETISLGNTLASSLPFFNKTPQELSQAGNTNNEENSQLTKL